MDVHPWRSSLRTRTLWLVLGSIVGLSALSFIARHLGLVRWSWSQRGLGQTIANFTLRDLYDQPVSLADFASRKAVVLVFTGIDCPVGNLYMPRLVALEAKYSPRGVAFLAINSNASDTIEEITAHAREHHVSFPVLRDEANRLADSLRVERIGEVLVIDSSRQLIYRGAFDDQYARGAFKPVPTRHYLAEVLDAVLANEPAPVSLTSSIACPIERVEPQRARKRLRRPDAEFTRLRRKQSPPESIDVGPVTFAKHAEPIIRTHCQPCHRPGEVGPFHLMTYNDARRHADSIYEVVDQGLMPPWHADPNYGHFSNDRSLSEHDRAVLLAWIEQGTPPGDLSQIPPPAPREVGWTIGQPDHVIEMAEPFDVPAEGQIPIQKFKIATHFEQDMWVQAAQAMPGDRAVVHHICVFIIDPELEASGGDSESRAEIRPELVCYAPGDMPCVYPPGVAKRIPAGAILEIQVHYQPIGVPRFDRSSVGLIWARIPVNRIAITRGAANRDLVLKPHASNVLVQSSYTLQEDADLLSLTPHMHYRGRDFRYDVVFPDGRRQTLLSVPYYDFNWQNVYRLATPLSLPRGTRIECFAHFDNSSANPLNPDPTQTVRWGEQSTDEMMIGYLDFCVDYYPRVLARRGQAPR